MTLTGEVESVDEGVLYVRLAPDSLTMIDAPDVAVAAGSWITLLIDARSLQLFAHDAD